MNREGMKRNRGSNFSALERSLLIELVTKYKLIIECKKTDGVGIKAKDDAWEKIQEDFNSNADVTRRTTKQLRQYYINTKRLAKKSKSDERIETYKTGGGQFKSNVDESVLSLIEDQIQPLYNVSDSAAHYYGKRFFTYITFLLSMNEMITYIFNLINYNTVYSTV